MASAERQTARMPGPKPPVRTLAAIASDSGMSESWLTMERATTNSMAAAARTSKVATPYGLHTRRGIRLRSRPQRGSIGGYHAARPFTAQLCCVTRSCRGRQSRTARPQAPVLPSKTGARTTVDAVWVGGAGKRALCGRHHRPPLRVRALGIGPEVTRTFVRGRAKHRGVILLEDPVLEPGATDVPGGPQLVPLADVLHSFTSDTDPRVTTAPAWLAEVSWPTGRRVRPAGTPGAAANIAW